MVTSVAVVLAGGVGNRLYPASRPERPKQFLTLGGDRSLLEAAADRAAVADEVLVVTRPAFVDRVAAALPTATILAEPAPKDTGPALAYASYFVEQTVEDPVILALPSDHRIGDGFASTARRALDVAAGESGLLTIGIEPTRAATEYGYIRPASTDGDVASVADFTEKPDRETAERFVEEGHLWNAGVFAWRPTAFLAAAADSPLEPLIDALEDGVPGRGYESVPATSVDRAVLESADDVSVIRGAFDWDDLGSWDAVGRLLDGENATLGDVRTVDATGNVVATDDAHVDVIGVDDLVVAAYDDHVVVVPKSAAQRVREIAETRLDDGTS
ncbi:MAG: mannose-1-phosphate guanylyltransferase [Halanaeroarchaeum sp.]